MKVTDLLESKDSTHEFETDELGDEQYDGKFKFEVTYWHEGESHSDHPYGEGTARETHGANWGIIGGKLKTQAKHIDVEAADKLTAKTFPAGTDIKKLPGWSKKVQEYYEEQLGKELDL